MPVAVKALQVINLDLQRSSNTIAHRTNEFMTEKLVVRRGEPFSMKVVFNRDVQPEDNLIWWTQIGHSSSKIILGSSNEQSWHATSKTNIDHSMVIAIKSPADAVIGRYLVGFQIKSGQSNVFHSIGAYILLFNPWCSDDPVYMEDDAARKEYVLNESGTFFVGSASENPPQRPWDFGQFEKGILDICLKMLDSSNEYRTSAAKDLSRRGDPSYVSRILSAMVNSPDDNGVIVGNWSGDYSGGEEPTRWNGSAYILRKWNESGPVRYGQCWVYAGVLCTVLRCLGIPARTISNFASAHDTDGNLIVDRYFDENGRELRDTADSIWNFHVWDEGWFIRKDIGSKYDGWQVVDSTPQERSKGSYRLGPCSVNAVKEGDVDKPYDAPFTFCEVNGDLVDWLVYSNKRIRINTQTSAIGKFISTKAIGSSRRADLTNNYKYTEGSKEEREIFNKAESICSSMLSRNTNNAIISLVALSVNDTEPEAKPDFKGVFTHNEPQIGQDVTYTLMLQSISSEKISVQLKMTATAIIYTNAQVKEILREVQSVTLEPKEEKNIPFLIPYAQYEAAITTDNMIKAVALCEDEKGGKLLVDSVMKLRSQPIVIKTTGEARVRQPLQLEIIFTNPISQDIVNAVLTVEGSGLVKEPIHIEIPCLKKNQQSVTNINIIPYRGGPRCVVVDLSSKKFSDIKGTLTINVSSA
ncbi:protein-glutamine gamma-glutamyltransferase E-like [Rana temporaria]|uniref:protein-glutamine gamma-glutamyltransferase E-like n=1 Tax=Rana temporaria TaxID=8407 RepID=UPI001AAD24A1|nr:protein-glutamine gamma-glutamyltransferase E-like [Rana temporaria]